MKPKKILFSSILFLSFCFSTLPFSAQHKTLKSSNGDALTEIIDANSMKQGEWIYYDSNDKVIRKEVYKDNEIQSRIITINGNELNAINYHIEDGLKYFVSKNPNFNGIIFLGEVVIDENGKIVSISFYNTLDSKMENLLKKEIMTIIENNYYGRKNLILTF
jgi:uncharacterized protein YuzE